MTGCIEGASHRTGTQLSFCFFRPVGVTLLCNLPGPRPILVDAVIQIQGLALRPGMGIVPGRKCGLLLRVVRGVDRWGSLGMVLAEFSVPVFVRAGRDVIVGTMIVLLVAMGGGCRFASW